MKETYTSKEFIKQIKNNPENFYIIHYSCENLNDNNKTLSPRITSIAIFHYPTKQSISFSMHLIAEENNILPKDMDKKYNDIEKILLEKFHMFISDKQNKFWIHWNMKNSIYGFEHISHRYRTLNGGKDPIIIPIERRINLNDILIDRYGIYAKNPKLPTLVELNNGRQHFLTGPQEVEAFKNKEFIKLHNSTLCKVTFFHFVIQELISGKLKTTSQGYGVKIDKLLESRSSKLICLLSAIIAIISVIFNILQFFRIF